MSGVKHSSSDDAPAACSDPEKIGGHDAVDQEVTVLRHADRNDADEALKVLQDGEVITLTPEDEKRLLRKIDWNLMPMLCLVYGLNYLDKTTVSYASIMGLKEDINLKGQEYSWIGSMFYFGYVGCIHTFTTLSFAACPSICLVLTK